MPENTIYPRNARDELRKIYELPDSPKEETLIETRSGDCYYMMASPRDRALQEWHKTLSVPYIIVRLWEDGAESDAPVRKEMERLRVQLRRAGVTALTADEEFREVESLARQWLELSDVEFKNITTLELETQLRYWLDKQKRPSGTSSPAAEPDASQSHTKSGIGRQKREPHPNPEEFLKNAKWVTYAKAGEALGLRERRIRQLVEEGKLTKAGTGQRLMITTASIRAMIESRQ